MKISSQLLVDMGNQIKQNWEKHKTQLVEHKAVLAKDSRVKDVDKRFRWDLFYAFVVQETKDSIHALDCYDSHIDTALKKLMSRLT